MITLQQLIAKKESVSWVPACGGTEQPFTIRGRVLIYMWNTFSKEHAYYEQCGDKFLENDDLVALGLS